MIGTSTSNYLHLQSFGACIQTDAWAADSMRRSLQAFLHRFEIEQPDDPLRKSLFRELEIARLATSFVETHHFLAFSGVEPLARSSGLNRSHPNAAMPISELPNQHGFLMTHSEDEDWCRARNEPFHRGRRGAR